MQSNRDMKGKKIWTVAAGSACLLVGCAQQPQGYAEKIMSNPLMNRVDSMEWALNYLFEEKMDQTRGLIIGATTADWGDVQPEHILSCIVRLND